MTEGKKTEETPKEERESPYTVSGRGGGPSYCEKGLPTYSLPPKAPYPVETR